MTKEGFVVDITRRFPTTDPAVVDRAGDLDDVARHLTETSPVTEDEARELIEAFYSDVDFRHAAA